MLCSVAYSHISLKEINGKFSNLVVPDLDLSVISPWDEVGLVSSTVVVNTIDSFLVTLQSEIRRRRA